MKNEVSQSRRRTLKNSLLLVAGAVGAGPLLLSPRTSHAQDLPKVSEDDPTAVQLKYTHDATSSARPSDDQFCHNCIYYKGTAKDEWAPCDLFPGKLVSGPGWCNVWTKRS